ncbi:hypothetical protein KX816_12045 [Sphingosinicellaceae bacterium]|nr:hypothetical protein KX816_12045 [Sphingosinicellaceae bacterium]
MARPKPIDLTPPAGVAREAAKGLKLREKFNRGGTDVGVNRAHQLSERKPVSAADITAISSYFKRHVVDKDAKSHKWGDINDPSPGYVAWLLWGGDPGERWADRVKSQLDKSK